MKIRQLQLKNIGVFDDETIEFQPCPAKDKAEIHIFTGQNGSGKTTILMALADGFQQLVNTLSKRLRHSDTHESGYQTTFDNQETTQYLKIPQDFHGSGHRSYGQVKDYQRLLSYDHFDSADFPRKFVSKGFIFAVFAFSGYRQLQSERIEAIKEPKEFNPLSQSLEFVKDYSQSNELTINQLIANNISKSAIEKGRNEEKSKKFANVIKSIEQAISEITDWKIEFDLETEPTNLITKVNGEELDFDVLPDGLRSLISWIADLLGRVDLLKWQDDLPIFEKNLILLLDEIEVHLHPEWQRKVLPVVQKLFKNSQIFVSTHSPFVVNSIDDAWVYELELKDGKAKVREKSLTNTAYSIQTVLREVFEIDERFGVGTQEKLVGFLHKSREIQNKNGTSGINKEDFLNLAIDLAERSAEIQSIVFVELAKISQKTGEPYEI